jgi:hypothetical protein
MLPYLETVRRRPEHPSSRLSATQGVSIASDSVVNRGAFNVLLRSGHLRSSRPLPADRSTWQITVLFGHQELRALLDSTVVPQARLQLPAPALLRQTGHQPGQFESDHVTDTAAVCDSKTPSQFRSEKHLHHTGFHLSQRDASLGRVQLSVGGAISRNGRDVKSLSLATTPTRAGGLRAANSWNGVRPEKAKTGPIVV